MAKTTIPQILDEVEKAGTKESRINILRAYDHPILRGIMQINFDPNVTVYLPEGEPPFKKDTAVPIGYSETNLYTEFRRFYIWLQKDINLTRVRKETLFIQFLEGIHWTEAEVICLSKDRKLQTKYKQLKEDLVREAFPGLLPAPAPKAVKAAGEPKTKKSGSLNAS
jgi:hypothetical protein